MIFDRNGIQLANVPNSGIVTKSSAQSGNSSHDSRSGKFTSGGRRDNQIRKPPNIDPLEYQRMLDAVRDAAREFDGPEDGDIREFVNGRANAPEKVDIDAFMNLVTEQRKSDLVDMLDQLLRNSGSMRIGRRKVRISAPKGFIRKSMNGLDEDDLANVMHRLQARGHSAEDVDRFFSSKTRVIDGARSRLAALADPQEWYAPDSLSAEPLEIDPLDGPESDSNQPIVVILNAPEVPDPVIFADRVREALGFRS